MSGRTITQYVLICDGCQVERPEAQSAVEARAAAYSDGWRFPAQVKADGSTSSNASDVCPACLPGWVVQPSRRRGPGQPGSNRRDAPGCTCSRTGRPYRLCPVHGESASKAVD